MTFDIARVALESLADCGLSVSTSAAMTLSETGCVVVEENAEALLAVGVPNVSLETQQRWLGGIRIGIWPRTAFGNRRIAVVSSRLGRKLSQHAAWFDAFRTLVCRLDPQTDVLVTADGTTADRFIKRAAMLFGLNHFSLSVNESSVEQQLSQFCKEPLANRIELGKPIAVSNALKFPVADRLITTLAHHVRALWVKKGSQTHRLLAARLADDGFPAATVHVSRESEAAIDLADAGAALRILIAPNSPAKSRTVVSTVPKQLGQVFDTGKSSSAGHLTTLTAPPFDDYLLHWTRRADGPWPDEQIDDYLDNLILGVEAGDRTAFATLARIVQTRKLLGTSHLIRGQYQMVCLSDLPLGTMAAGRTYRTHLRRWDYEPYGIGIRKSRLEQLGARPALYKKATDYQQMSESDRPYFQLEATADARIQWTDEAEWRHHGDLNLEELAGDVFVFVPSRDEAAAIRRHCEWPIVVLETGSD